MQECDVRTHKGNEMTIFVPGYVIKRPLPINYNKNLNGKFAVISDIQVHVFTVLLLTLPARFFSLRLLPTSILFGQRFSIAGITDAFCIVMFAPGTALPLRLGLALYRSCVRKV